VVWGRDDTDAFRRFPFRSPYGKQLWDLGREVVRDRIRAPGERGLTPGGFRNRALFLAMEPRIDQAGTAGEAGWLA
jgi:hypothetical protein